MKLIQNLTSKSLLAVVSLLSIMALSGCGGGGGGGGGSSGITITPDDHSNMTTDATSLALPGGSANGNINTPTDEDYFKLVITAVGTLTVATTNSRPHTAGELYSPVNGDPQIVGVTDTTRSVPPNFNYTYAALPARTYYLKVYRNPNTNNATATGAYTVTATFTPADDHSNTTADATVLALGGSGVDGNIETIGDVDYFMVAIVHPGNLTVTTTGTTATTGTLTGHDLASSVTSSTGGAGSNFSLMQAVTIGTYYVAVAETDDDGTGGYNVAATFVATDVGNERSLATVLALGSSISSRIEVTGSSQDADYFSITIPGTGTLTVYTTGSTATLGELYQAITGNSIAINGGGGNFRIAQSVTARTYYVAMVGHLLATGDYTVFADFTPNN